MTWTVGIDLGGSKIAFGLVSPQDKIVRRERSRMDADDRLEAVLERIAGQVERLRDALPAGERISSVGICTPGPVDHVSGDLLTLVNLPGISNSPLRRALQARLGLPVRLDHDAKAAALGEFLYGAGKAGDSLIYIVLGTGVGAAIIYEGALLYGEGNSAGECGHMTVNPSGQRCHCGSRGCLETYASGPALARHYAAASGERVDGAAVTRRARAGDEKARAVLHSAGRALGIAVATLAMTLNIETFIIGGSVANAGDLLLDAARESLREYAFAAVSAKVRLAASELGEDAAILGAAALGRSLA